MQTVFKEIAGEFERASGHRLIIAYGTIGGITQRVLDGEMADVVIASTVSMPALVTAGKIDAGSQVTICKTGIGIVVPAGTPKPRVASVEDFKQAVLAAKTIVYADPVRGGAAGVHVAKVLQQLGIAEQLKPTIKVGAGGDVTEVTLAQGNGALGITQISEIVGKLGAEFVGLLPDELQKYTIFVAGTPADRQRSEAISAFVSFLKQPAPSPRSRQKACSPTEAAGDNLCSKIFFPGSPSLSRKMPRSPRSRPRTASACSPTRWCSISNGAPAAMIAIRTARWWRSTIRPPRNLSRAGLV